MYIYVVTGINKFLVSYFPSAGEVLVVESSCFATVVDGFDCVKEVEYGTVVAPMLMGFVIEKITVGYN